MFRSLLMKIFICPLGVWLSSVMFPSLINFQTLYHILIVGLVVAVAGWAMETILLRKGTVWISTIVDFVAAAVVVYVIPLLFFGYSISFLGALITAAILAVTEHFQHLYLAKHIEDEITS